MLPSSTLYSNKMTSDRPTASCQTAIHVALLWASVNYNSKDFGRTQETLLCLKLPWSRDHCKTKIIFCVFEMLVNVST